MYEELENEFAEFKKDFDDGSLIFGRYLNEDDYEDEYSHNEIDECKLQFVERVKDYLHEKAHGKYIVSDGWCVFIMTIEEAMKRKIHRYEDYIVS